MHTTLRRSSPTQHSNSYFYSMQSKKESLTYRDADVRLWVIAVSGGEEGGDPPARIISLANVSTGISLDTINGLTLSSTKNYWKRWQKI